MRLLLILIPLIVFSLTLKPNSQYRCKVIRVIDGDTFKCKILGDGVVRVRLIGVDTPESRVNRKAIRDSLKMKLPLKEIIKMGKVAKAFTKSLLKKGMVVVLETDVQVYDRYGRVLAYVWLRKGLMLNELLLREGYAQVMTIPPNVKYVETFLSAQRYAIKHQKGFWK